ncbi:GNAT family N-acetyltransferase [Sutcliffiella horikoshii]|uniref:GNAT family N-acetyltransferase n=1 Tax=Sutcliffiella horikoshii TaxID=79883 RepID=UPI00203C8B9B|nr:GNAT family N-acetyltransferase [Sutcliffiella horikoshii]MCM3618326.1 GNAT family N-acetyltransferase [Sutcliffiella horikoshii]
MKKRESTPEIEGSFFEEYDMEKKLRIVPANEASWEHLELVLGEARCHGEKCYCQRFKLPNPRWRETDDDERAFLLKLQTNCGNSASTTTSGLIAFWEGEPVGWCALEPRNVYIKLRTSRVIWAERNEDKNDDKVWAVTCFIVRNGFRKRGIIYALTRAAVNYAEKRGAHALEGYPMITEAGKDITWGELHVGAHKAFIAAGFHEITEPTKRRKVMRVDFLK